MLRQEQILTNAVPTVILKYLVGQSMISQRVCYCKYVFTKVQSCGE